MRIQLTIALVTLLIGQSLTERSCHVCGGSAYYDTHHALDRYVKAVCGVNGLTYKNKCYLKCNEVDMAHHGVCNSKSESDMPCGCDPEFAPVQSISGMMYRNKCVANCHGIEALPMAESPKEQEEKAPQEIPSWLVQESMSGEDAHNSTHNHSVNPRNSDSFHHHSSNNSHHTHSSHSGSKLFSRSDSTSEMNDLETL